MNLIQKIAELDQNRIPCVVATIISRYGSTPTNEGTKMVMTQNNTFGSLGGGKFEYHVQQKAKELLQTYCHQKIYVENYPLGAQFGQCCGGKITVLFELMQQKQQLYLFGAGHVGKALIQVLEGLPINILWIDQRADEFPESIPDHVQKIITDDPTIYVEDINKNAIVVIMTHDHGLDFQLLEIALKKPELNYIGMIGSKKKRERFEQRLKNKKIDYSNWHCPIGQTDIKSKLPKAIAISIASQLLVEHNNISYI